MRTVRLDHIAKMAFLFVFLNGWTVLCLARGLFFLQVASTGVPSTVPADDTALISYGGGRTLSSDGRYVVFASYATNLVAQGADGNSQVYRRDLTTGLTELVSADHENALAVGNAGSAGPTISGDGNFVVFWSYATNLVPSGVDSNNVADIYLRDMTKKITTLISTGHGGIPADKASVNPVISADGRYVAFASLATNLIDVPTSGLQVFRRSASDAAQMELVSQDALGNPGNGTSRNATISGDGRYVAFESYASNLQGPANNTFPQVWRRDMQNASTQLVSQDTNGLRADGPSLMPAISDDGRYVVFASGAPDVITPPMTNVQVLRRDMAVGTTAIVSGNANGPLGNDVSDAPSISADGRFVAFQSVATNLVSGDGNQTADVFVKDMSPSAVLVRVTDIFGTEGAADSYAPVISANGVQLMLATEAQNWTYSVGTKGLLRDIIVATNDTIFSDGMGP